MPTNDDDDTFRIYRSDNDGNRLYVCTSLDDRAALLERINAERPTEQDRPWHDADTHDGHGSECELDPFKRHWVFER